MTAEENRRPLGKGTAAKEAFRGAETMVPPTPDLADLDTLAGHVNGAFVVVVELTGETTHYRRRPYLTAAAAEAAARKAQQRGQNARIYLAELKPLWRIIGMGDPEVTR